MPSDVLLFPLLGPVSAPPQVLLPNRVLLWRWEDYRDLVCRWRDQVRQAAPSQQIRALLLEAFPPRMLFPPHIRATVAQAVHTAQRRSQHDLYQALTHLYDALAVLAGSQREDEVIFPR
jgi:hypothetical protein